MCFGYSWFLLRVGSPLVWHLALGQLVWELALGGEQVLDPGVEWMLELEEMLELVRELELVPEPEFVVELRT